MRNQNPEQVIGEHHNPDADLIDFSDPTEALLIDLQVEESLGS